MSHLLHISLLGRCDRGVGLQQFVNENDYHLVIQKHFSVPGCSQTVLTLQACMETQLCLSSKSADVYSPAT